MAMDFWDAQRRARKKTTIYLVVFVAMTLSVAALVEIAIRSVDHSYEFPFIGLGFLAITFAVAGFQYLRFRHSGGKQVALSLGAIEISRDTDDPKERQLLNIVQEIAISSSMPVPPVFVIEAQEINAFAAGLSPSTAAIAVTQGTLEKLSRDEIQGVIAHEFGHIKNGDMTIGLRLAAMVMGFFFVLHLGFRILTSIRRSRKKDGSYVALIGLALLVAGALTWLFGSILKASVSRQREYLADASSVQFTRNPDGLAGALKKIQQQAKSDMPKAGVAFSHMYFSNRGFWSSLFATHPPLEKRIDVIQNKRGK